MHPRPIAICVCILYDFSCYKTDRLLLLPSGDLQIKENIKLVLKWLKYNHQTKIEHIISTNRTKLRNDCNSEMLSVVFLFTLCLHQLIYCRGLKYSLKLNKIIRNYPSVARFLILETLCLGRSKTLPYIWKEYYKKEHHLCLVKHNFTKLSQNMCLINTHILVYQYARHNCKLWYVL